MVSRPSFALLPVCVAFFAIYPTAAYAKQEIAESLAAYGYRGVTMGASSAEVRSACPNAVLDATHHGTNLGIQTYEVWDDEHYDCVLLRLVDDAVIEIDFICFPEQVAQQGGMESLLANANKRYGVPTTQTAETRLWDFPESDRMLIAFMVKGKWSQHLYHRSRRLAIAGYKDTTVNGRRSQLVIRDGGPVIWKSPKTTPPAKKSEQVAAQVEHAKNPYAAYVEHFEIGNLRIGMQKSQAKWLQYTPGIGDQLRTIKRSGSHLRFGIIDVGLIKPDWGDVTYAIPNGEDRQLLARFQYGGLVAITDLRENLNLSRVADLQADQAAAIHRFGPNYTRDGNDRTWRFRSVNRKVDYRVKKTSGNRHTVTLRVSFLSARLP